eukprot:m51a1_g9273 putative dmt family transporter: udp-galactose udp-glucose (390) ;mRNA; f:96256-97753
MDIETGTKEAAPPSAPPSAPAPAPRGPSATATLAASLSSRAESLLSLRPGAARLVSLALGIMGSLVAYGVLQERIMTHAYGEAGELFGESAFLVFANRVAGALVAAAVLRARGERLTRAAVPWSSFFGVSASNVVATWCQYEALKYVSFPAQTLGKTGKMIPVMVLGVLLQGKRYGVREVTLNAVITLGCTAFILGGDVKSSRVSAEGLGWWAGIALMGLYLTVDGFTSTLQEKLFRGNKKMSTYNQMLFVNACSSVLSLGALLLTGSLFRALAFVSRNPGMLLDASFLSLAAVLGQVCIYSTIREFGALVFAGIMVTRQVVSVVVSCLVYGHPMSFLQLLSASVVFVTLYVLEGSKRHSRPPPQPILPVTSNASGSEASSDSQSKDTA